MYGPLSSAAEQHRQDLLQSAEQQRLVKEARANIPSGSFYRVIRQAVAVRFNNLGEQLQDSAVPVRANHAQVEFDSGVFSVR